MPAGRPYGPNDPSIMSSLETAVRDCLTDLTKVAGRLRALSVRPEAAVMLEAVQA